MYKVFKMQMRIQFRLLSWFMGLAGLSVFIGIALSGAASTGRLNDELLRRSSLIAASLESSTWFLVSFDKARDQETNRMLRKVLAADSGVDSLMVVDRLGRARAWSSTTPERELELGIATPEDRLSITSHHYSLSTSSRAESLRYSVAMSSLAGLANPAIVENLAGTANSETENGKPQKTEPSSTQSAAAAATDAEATAPDASKSKVAAGEPKSGADDAKVEISATPPGVGENVSFFDSDYELLVSFKGSVREDLVSYTRTLMYLAVIPCLLLFAVLLWFFLGSIIEGLDYLRGYALAIAAGDLTHPIVFAGAPELHPVGEAIDSIRRSFKTLIAHNLGANENFSEVSLQMLESSQQITDDAIEQSHAIRTTVSDVDLMAESSTTTQHQIGDTAKAVSESSKHIKAIGQSMDAIVSTTSLLSRSVDQTKRHLEGNISILGEVDRGVTKLQESASEAVTASSGIEKSIRMVEADTQSALRMVNETSSMADKGVVAFQDAMEALSRIRENNDEAAGSIRDLSEKTASIGHILAVIDEISNRTKLLSLNASIIASHAGDAGKGFMIVAEEIKDLAARTAGSTREIAKIIGEVRDGSEDAIDVVEKGMLTVNEGVKQSERTGEVLAQIVASTDQTSNLVRRVSAAMSLQSKGTKSVNLAMREVHGIVVKVRQVVSAQKGESRDLEASIRTMRIQMSRAVATARRQISVINAAVDSIAAISEHIERISNSNRQQLEHQRAVSKAVEGLRQLSDTHHKSASSLATTVEQAATKSAEIVIGVADFQI